MRRGFLLGLVGLALLCLPALASGRVLLVGTYHGIKGQYSSIEAAVDAAKANDWILIGPGDYKTTGGETVSGAGTHFPAGNPDHKAWDLRAGHEPQQRNRGRNQERPPVQ